MRADFKKTLLWFLLFVFFVAVFIYIALFTLRDSVSLYYEDLSNLPEDKIINIGGIVSNINSTKQFELLGINNSKVNIVYHNQAPLLFRLNQGVVLKGKLNTKKEFIATKMLIKHDEVYKKKK